MCNINTYLKVNIILIKKINYVLLEELFRPYK